MPESRKPTVERITSKSFRAYDDRDPLEVHVSPEGNPQPNFIPSAAPNPDTFQYRLLTEADRAETLLIKVKALEEEHYALSNNFTLGGVATGPTPEEQEMEPGEADLQVILARARARRKAEIEVELEALHARVDIVRERAKAKGITLFEEAREMDAERAAQRTGIVRDGAGHQIAVDPRAGLSNTNPIPGPVRG